MIKKGWLCVLAAAAVLLAACGIMGVGDYIDQNYVFVDAIQNNTVENDRALLYRSNIGLSETAEELIGVEEPERIGEAVDGRQVLVYDDEFVILTEDPENPGTTLVEVAEEEFVRRHYHPGFFTGMFVGSFLNDRLGRGWVSSQRNRCGPGGCYSGGGAYGTFPAGTFGRGAAFRGGGPGAGK